MKQHAGITLIEIFLALTIAMVAFTLGLRMYYALKMDSDMRQVQSNVDAIFNAMGQYYRVNCWGYYQPLTGAIVPGTLNPTYVPAPLAAKSIDIPTDLIAPGFLERLPVLTPIVVNVGAGTSGYVAQFNKTTAPRRICTSGPNCATSVSGGQIVSWSAQVSAQVKDNATASRMMNTIGAYCHSALNGTTIFPCTSAQAGPFVVWERNVSSLSENNVRGSTYGETMQTVKQFTQMYTTNPVTSLTSGATSANQYYLCGN